MLSQSAVTLVTNHHQPTVGRKHREPLKLSKNAAEKDREETENRWTVRSVYCEESDWELINDVMM